MDIFRNPFFSPHLASYHRSAFLHHYALSARSKYRTYDEPKPISQTILLCVNAMMYAFRFGESSHRIRSIIPTTGAMIRQKLLSGLLIV